MEKASALTILGYDLIGWILSLVFNCFFREIRPRGAFRIPKKCPIIFVAAPHANQFVDAGILMNQVKNEANRRLSFLIAEKSMKVNGIKQMAKLALAIPVKRAQDNLKTASGEITLDPENPLKILGFGTKFTQEAMPKGLIGLPKSKGNTEILEILRDTELILKKEFKKNAQEILRNKTSYKLADKIDQRDVYEKVFAHLSSGECIGIFPEGGSHDRTDLLPLKAGVAIMALGAMEKHTDCDVKIVPCGMNYFHPHKFRSRCVVEFGHPITISKELVAMYSDPKTSKEAIKKVLETVENGLRAVTVTCPDYETLMVVQAARRLYTNGKTLPIPLVVEMNRRLVLGYQHYKNETEIIELKKKILNYNRQLKNLNLPDHDVEYAQVNYVKNIGILIQRSIKLVFLGILSLPGILLFTPIFIFGKAYSQKKKREALASSIVKIKANDVVATWKILIGMGFAPILYIFYSIVGVYLLRDRAINKLLLFSAIYMMSVTVTYSALIIGDSGMDLFKSIRPIYLSLVQPSILQDLQQTKQSLRKEIIEIVNRLGSELFPDFDHLKSDNFDEALEDRKTKELRKRRREKRKQEQQKLLQQQQEQQLHASESSDVESISNISIFASSDPESDVSESSVDAIDNRNIGDNSTGASSHKVVDALRERRIRDQEEEQEEEEEST